MHIPCRWQSTILILPTCSSRSEQWAVLLPWVVSSHLGIRTPRRRRRLRLIYIGPSQPRSLRPHYNGAAWGTTPEQVSNPGPPDSRYCVH